MVSLVARGAAKSSDGNPVACDCQKCRMLDQRLEILTPLQIDVIYWIAQGKTDREIGQILGISPKTVNYHVERLKQRMGVSTRIQLVIACIHCGLLVVADVAA